MGGVGWGWRDNGRRAVRSSAGFSKMGSRLSSTSGRPVDQPSSRLPDEPALHPLAACGPPSPASGRTCRPAPEEGCWLRPLGVLLSILFGGNNTPLRLPLARTTLYLHIHITQ